MSSIRKFLFGRPGEPVTLAQSVAMPHCTNCGNELQGPYCSNCGQKKEGHHEVTIAHFFGHAVHEFTHVDSRILRSLKCLLFKPGYLTQEFIIGHRKKLINPIRLFILVNVIYFIFVYLIGNCTFSTPLRYQTMGRLQQHQKRMVDDKVKELNIPYTTYEKNFDHYTLSVAKSLIIIMVPMFAIIVGLLFFNRRRYAIEYLAFSLEAYSMILLFISFGLLALVVSSSLLLLLADKLLILLNVIDLQRARQNMAYLASVLNDDTSMSTIIILIGSILLFTSFKRVFRQSNFATFLKTSVSAVAICYIVHLYRIILFYVTFYTMHIPK